MKKFMFLYIGPYKIDLNMQNPPITQASLDEWAQSVGNNILDRGTLFGSDGKSAIDRGDVTKASIPIQGYSIVQANDINEAVSLTQGHPILKNGNKGFFEVEVLELISGEIPLDATVALKSPAAAQSDQAPTPILDSQQQQQGITGDNYQAQQSPDGELDIQHDDSQDDSGNQPPYPSQPGQGFGGVQGPQDQQNYGQNQPGPAGPYQPQQNPGQFPQQPGQPQQYQQPQQQDNMPLPPSQQGPPPPLPPQQRQHSSLNHPDDPLVM